MSLVIFLLVLIVIVVASPVRPGVAFAAYVLMIGIDHWGSTAHPFMAGKPWLTNFIVGIALILGAASQFRRKDRLKTIGAAHIAALALVIYAGVSFLWSPFSGDLGWWQRRGTYDLVAVALVPLLLSRLGDVVVALRSIMVIGAISAGFLAFSVNWFNRRIIPDWATDVLIRDPLNVAWLGGVVFLVAVLAQPPAIARRFGLQWILATLCVYLVILTGSRGQFVFMIALGVILLPLSMSIRRMSQFVPLLAGAVMIVAAGYYFYSEFVSGGARWTTDQVMSDWEGRLAMGRTLLEAWWSTPMTLTFGLGNSAAFSIIGRYPHNLPLEVLAEEGLVGILIYLTLITYGIRAAIRGYRLTARASDYRKTYTALLAIVLYSGLLSLKQGSLMGVHGGLFLGLVATFERYVLLLERNGQNKSKSNLTPDSPKIKRFQSRHYSKPGSRPPIDDK